jgi:transcriptional regulator with XRE-family HTH domain
MFETLGDRIRKARGKRGLSQRALAEKLGITRAAMSQIESGVTRDPSGSRLRDMAVELNVSVDYLVGLTEEADGESALAAAALV